MLFRSAQKLLVRVSEAWGRTTCLQLALEAKDMKFVSHGGIQVTFWGPPSRKTCLGLQERMQPPVHHVRSCGDPGMVLAIGHLLQTGTPSPPCLPRIELMLSESGWLVVKGVAHLCTGWEPPAGLQGQASAPLTPATWGLRRDTWKLTGRSGVALVT